MRRDARIRAVCGEGTVHLQEGAEYRGVFGRIGGGIFGGAHDVPLVLFFIVSGGQTVCKTRTPQRNGGYAGFTLRGVVLVFG